MGNDSLVLIVGAGPTGLAFAIELARSGHPVRIIDKSSGPAKWSQALVVQARTLEQFERYGIADTAVATGHPIRHARMFHHGHRIVDLDLSRVASRYPFVLFLPQNETEALLLKHLSGLGVEVERDTECAGFSDGIEGGTANIRRGSGASETVPYRWLVGCDGAHSVVRHVLQIPFEGDTVGLRFFLGDLKLSGTDVPGDDLVIHLQHGDVLFLAQMRGGITRVIAAEHSAQDEAGDRIPTISDFQRWIDAYHLQIRVEEAEWCAPFHINQRKARYYRKGNAFLAGDASHIHSPVAGQGMNTGLQDAANLAWKLSAVAHGAPDALLDSYNEERGAVGDALLKSTSAGLRAATTANPVAELMRDSAAAVITHLPTMQNKVAAFVSETSIDYRGSSIVKDTSGSGTLRAGDRVPNPDVTLADGSRRRLLAPLVEAKHLLIVQGAAEDARLASAVHGINVTRLAPDQPQDALEILGSDPGLWLVRPDGYLGFRGALTSTSELAAYARTAGIAAE